MNQTPRMPQSAETAPGAIRRLCAICARPRGRSAGVPLMEVKGRSQERTAPSVADVGVRALPLVLIGVSFLLWLILPASVTLQLVPWLSGLLLSISGLYLFSVVRELESALRPPRWNLREQPKAGVACPAGRRRLCVASLVTLTAFAGGPVLAVLAWAELQANQSLALAGFLWALCVGGLALSLVIGEFMRQLAGELLDHDATADAGEARQTAGVEVMPDANPLHGRGTTCADASDD